MPTTVHAQARPRAAAQPRRSPKKAAAASKAVRESAAAVGTANSAGIPGDRLGTRRPTPRTRNISGATQALGRQSGDSAADHGRTRNSSGEQKPQELQDEERDRFHLGFLPALHARKQQTWLLISHIQRGRDAVSRLVRPGSLSRRFPHSLSPFALLLLRRRPLPPLLLLLILSVVSSSASTPYPRSLWWRGSEAVVAVVAGGLGGVLSSSSAAHPSKSSR